MPGDLREWLALRLARGVGEATFHRLVAHFGSPGAAFGRPAGELAALGVPAPTAALLARGMDEAPVLAQLRAAERLGVRLVTRADPSYPPGLDDLPDPPPVLWLSGELPSAGSRRVGIVGTRDADGYGRMQALRLAGGCARAGCWVVSGGARGIDSAAHEGALAAGGRTLVVLGSGLDRPYPSEHRDLFSRIAAAGGGVVSELPLGSRPTRGTFPRRNRLIAALGEATVVVQAGRRSGALLTAADARQLGRPVLAVPGAVDREGSAGVHQLLRDGAALCEGAADVLEILGIRGAPPATPSPPERDGDAERVLSALADGALTFDQVAVRAGLDVGRAADALLQLELAGRVGLEGGYYFQKRT